MLHWSAQSDWTRHLAISLVIGSFWWDKICSSLKVVQNANDKTWWSLNNRRLFVFRSLYERGCLTRVHCNDVTSKMAELSFTATQLEGYKWFKQNMVNYNISASSEALEDVKKLRSSTIRVRPSHVLLAAILTLSVRLETNEGDKLSCSDWPHQYWT